jgi:hypothetical protein
LRDLDDLIESLYKLIPVSLAEQMQLIQEDAAAILKNPQQFRLFQEALADNEEPSDASSLSKGDEPTIDITGTPPPPSFFSSAMARYKKPISAGFASVASSKASLAIALSYQASFDREKGSSISNIHPGNRRVTTVSGIQEIYREFPKVQVRTQALWRGCDRRCLQARPMHSGARGNS